MTADLIAAPIDHRAFRVLAAVMLLRDHDSGTCLATNEAIGKACGLAPGKVQEELKALQEAGIISRDVRGRRRVISTPATGVQQDQQSTPATGTPAKGVQRESTPAMGVVSPPPRGSYSEEREIQRSAAAPHARHDTPENDPSEVDRVAIWAGNYATIFDSWVRAQSALYPIAWIEAAVDKAMGAGATRPSYAKPILEQWQRDGGPPVPAPTLARSPSAPISKHDRRRIEEEAGWAEFDRQIKGGVA
jgi:hypothetical protein